MTVRELIDILKRYPPTADVKMTEAGSTFDVPLEEDDIEFTPDDSARGGIVTLVL